MSDCLSAQLLQLLCDFVTHFMKQVSALLYLGQ